MGTGLALLVFFQLTASIGATRTATVAYLVPVAVLLYGVAFSREPITARALLELALILAGVSGLRLRRPPHRSRKAPPAHRLGSGRHVTRPGVVAVAAEGG